MNVRSLCTILALASCAIPASALAGDSAYERYGACLKAQFDAARDDVATAESVKTEAVRACARERADLEASLPPPVAAKVMPEVDARVDAAFARDVTQ